MDVLVVGSGGREHCLAWKLKQSPLVERVFCAPGNAGTSTVAENVPIKAEDIKGLRDFAKRQKIGLTIVGPEMPLAMGIENSFAQENLRVFGPSCEAAEIESSKVFCRKLLEKHGVPQPEFSVFDDAQQAIDSVKNKGCPIVVKADGLASGKGVIVAETEEQAINAINKIMVEKAFGDAGKKIVLEERLFGQEASFVCFVDGEHALPLESSQDHKRALDGDRGENTGGMGAYSPTMVMDFETEQRALEKIVLPTVRALKEANREFRGILYAGLMIRDGKPFLLEFNSRFGDPETQAVLPRMQTDLMEPLLASTNASLQEIDLKWKEIACTCVVLASRGYPGKYEAGKIINGLNIAKSVSNAMIFQAGTKILQGRTITNAGRVLNVVGSGKSIRESIDSAYAAIKKISFDGMYYRTDIGRKALS